MARRHRGFKPENKHTPKKLSEGEKVSEIPKVIQRMGKEEFEDTLDISDNCIIARDSNDQPVTVGTILRQGPSEHKLYESEQSACSANPEDEAYVLLHRRKTAELWNQAFKEHNVASNECAANFVWDNDACEKNALLEYGATV